MQVELTALQPQLIQTSEETARMMVKIEEETREADAKKLLVQADEKESNAAAAIAQGIKVTSIFWGLSITSLEPNTALQAYPAGEKSEA